MTVLSADPEIDLLIPDGDVDDPVLTILIPALNEELTVTDFVRWCKEGLEAAGVEGEILIVDSGDDRTTERALAGGARVLRTPRRGLGRAYIDALPYVRGRWIVMGDADCTYDFRQLAPFVAGFEDDYEYVMGSRWKGSIEAGSMPALHRYFGTPLTTFILNVVYSSKFSDIHCGMRGITKDALERMNLQSQSWEYASEMVLKSVHMELRTTEVPVTFLKDREGRQSHHKREGWLSPFKAAWINLQAMFIYGSHFFLLKPGIVMMVIGLLLTLPLTFGDLDLGFVTLSLNTQFLGAAVLAIGTQAFFMGCIAQVLFDYTGRATRRWSRLFPYTRSVLISFALILGGILATLPLIVTFSDSGFLLERANTIPNHLAVTGLAAVITGAQLFGFVLVLLGTIIATTRGRPRVRN
jgi:glycosyltransferase involved in cell wall biosynthesis